jgi:metal-sulfur cluster biosynthetic enzyme
MFLEVTVTGTVAVWVTPPPVAVTVTFAVPAVAVVLAVNVSAELPLPGAAMDVGLKLAVSPEDNPEAESDTAELNPPFTAMETVVLPELPCATDKLGGETLRVKSGAVVAFTVSGTVSVCDIPPPLPVTVTFAVPVVAVLLAENVTVEFPFPGAPIEVGLKLAVTPVGNPEADSEIAELKP